MQKRKRMGKFLVKSRHCTLITERTNPVCMRKVRVLKSARGHSFPPLK